MELQSGFNTLGLDIFTVLYHIWLYHRVGISKDTTMPQLALAVCNFLLLRQLIIWTLPIIRFNSEQTDRTIIVLLQVIWYWICNELYMYWAHRCLHYNKFLYSNIHYMHHQVKGECFSTAMYMHPLETVLFIYPNLMLGPFLLYLYQGWVYKESMLIWTCLATFYFIWSHSGVTDSQYMPSTIHHLSHHGRLNCAFGSIITDTLFGTMPHK